MAMLAFTVLLSPFLIVDSARAAGVPECSVGGQITPHPTNWYSIKVPAFPTGSQVMSDYAVEPLAANSLYVTNGVVVLHSTDWGCTWSTSYELPAVGELTRENAHILEIAVGPAGTVYLPIQQTEPRPRPRVVVSTDGGATWTGADGPLMTSVIGEIRDFDASSGASSVATMLVDLHASQPGVGGVSGQQLILRTTSAGQTWELPMFPEANLQVVTPQAGIDVLTAPVMERIAISPTQPDVMWLYGREGLFYLNGSDLNQLGGDPVRVLDIALDGGAVVTYSTGPEGQVTFDEGQSFVPFATGLPVESADMGASAPLQIATGSAGRLMYQMWPPGQSKPAIVDASPQDGRLIFDVQVAFNGPSLSPSVYARTQNTIEVTFQPEGEEIDEKLTEIQLRLDRPGDLGATRRLVPARTQIKMDAGKSRTTHYRLDLPAATTPLDVYFLIDISASMQGAIDGIKTGMQEIIDHLYAAGIDVHFGVGSFRAYNNPPAYDRVHQIAPATSDLAAALNSLRAAGGGDETQMAALLQSVTGEGDGIIPAGLEMRFRPGSLRVAIEVTDEPISKGGNHPAIPDVIDALVAADVKQVGLAIEPVPFLGEHDYERPGEPARDLMDVARGSNAVVPPGVSVDCDGDADADLHAGDPIVCLVDPSRANESSLMADAIVNVLDAVEDVRDLDVVAVPPSDPTADSPVIDTIEPGILQDIDLKEPNKLEFDVTARCPHVSRRTMFPVQVAVQRSSAVLGQALLEVTCIPPPDPPSDVAPLLAAFVPTAVVPPAPRPPDPIPEPNPNPNPQPNPQSNPQAQAGFAAQKQQQPQVALAGQEALPPESASEQVPTDEYRASSRRESRVPPVGFIFAVAAMTSVYGYAMATRSRTRTAEIRTRKYDR